MSVARHWTSPDGRFDVVLTERASRRLESILGRTTGRETGGILVGRYDDDHRVATIEEVTGAPADSLAGPNWFVRGTKRLAELLAQRWRSAYRTYYLGEWHHHPARVVEGSTDDFEQMASIAEDDAYRCPEPVMLIAGILDRDGRSMRVFVTRRAGARYALAETTPPASEQAVGPNEPAP